jgi:acyl carrier protein
VIAEKVIAYLVELKGLPDQSSIQPDTMLLQSGIVDSLGMEELISFLEATFGIEVAIDDMMPDNFETVVAITALVESKLGGESS